MDGGDVCARQRRVRARTATPTDAAAGESPAPYAVCTWMPLHALPVELAAEPRTPPPRHPYTTRLRGSCAPRAGRHAAVTIGGNHRGSLQTGATASHARALTPRVGPTPPRAARCTPVGSHSRSSLGTVERCSMARRCVRMDTSVWHCVGSGGAPHARTAARPVSRSRDAYGGRCTSADGCAVVAVQRTRLSVWTHGPACACDWVVAVAVCLRPRTRSASEGSLGRSLSRGLSTQRAAPAAETRLGRHGR